MAAPVDVLNALRADLFQTQAHASAGSAVSTPDATSDSTAGSLATDLRASMLAHFASVCSGSTGIGSHGAADTTTPLPATVTPATAPSLAHFVSDLEYALATHCKRGRPLHYEPDLANAKIDVYPTPSDTFQWRRLNAIKANWNAHLASARVSQPAT